MVLHSDTCPVMFVFGLQILDLTLSVRYGKEMKELDRNL